MKLMPFEKVSGIPNGQENFVDVLSGHEFIDIADIFILDTVDGIRESYHSGVVAYMFEANLQFGFDNKYQLTSVEFSEPVHFPQVDGLFFKEENLFVPTLKDAYDALMKIKVPVQVIDVGIGAPTIGVSFFSDDFEEDLNAKLDIVTVETRY